MSNGFVLGSIFPLFRLFYFCSVTLITSLIHQNGHGWVLLHPFYTFIHFTTHIHTHEQRERSRKRQKGKRKDGERGEFTLRNCFPKGQFYAGFPTFCSRPASSQRPPALNLVHVTVYKTKSDYVVVVAGVKFQSTRARQADKTQICGEKLTQKAVEIFQSWDFTEVGENQTYPGSFKLSVGDFKVIFKPRFGHGRGARVWVRNIA